MTFTLEKKYWLNLNQYYLLKQWLLVVARMDKHCLEHNAYPVYSRYFDDKDYSLLHQKTDGLYQHIRVRLRTYDHKFNSKPLFWEIKYKNDRVLKKYRSPAVQSLENLPAIPAEIAAIAWQKSLYPVCNIFYWREAFFLNLPGQEVRLCLDTAAQTCKHTGALPGPSGFALWETNSSAYAILEIKQQQDNLPPLLKDKLAQLNINQTTISKYWLAMTVLDNHRFSEKILSKC